ATRRPALCRRPLQGLKELRMLATLATMATGVDCTAKKRRCVKNSAAGGRNAAATPSAVRFGLLMLPQDFTALMSETEDTPRDGKDNAAEEA
ncbi:hypothetical protein KR044_000146, partial [Drosophila immigrans]